MRKLILFFIATFAAPIMAATTPANLPENLSLKVDFNYTHQQDNKMTDTFIIKNYLHISTTNHKWTVVPDTEANTDKDRYILLTQVESANSDEITLNFLILDMNSKEPLIVSKPRIIVHYDQPAQIALENGNEKIKLTILAKA